MEDYGKRIKKFRNERGYSQELMAEQLGMSQNAYSKLEKGSTQAKADILKRIAKILEIDESKLHNDSPIDANTYNIEQHNHDNQNGTGVSINNQTFEQIQELWRNIEFSHQQTIRAKNETITAKEETNRVQEILIVFLRSQVEALQERLEER
jgi:transcriptional regulator with XRE-family HTH domain